MILENDINQSVTQATRKNIPEFSQQESTATYDLPHTGQTLQFRRKYRIAFVSLWISVISYNLYAEEFIK